MGTIKCCNCGGDIRNAEAWKAGRYSWQWLNGVFPGKIRISDVDGIAERNGHGLWFETKNMDEKVPQGQKILLENFAAKQDNTVYVLWGEPDNPVMKRDVAAGVNSPTSREEINEIANEWFRRVDAR